VDTAAERTAHSKFVIAAVALYTLGTILLLAQSQFPLAPKLAQAGMALLLLGVAASFAVLGRIMMVRSRLIGG
jgi:membrane-bound ClpP family serine protease